MHVYGKDLSINCWDVCVCAEMLIKKNTWQRQYGEDLSIVQTPRLAHGKEGVDLIKMWGWGSIHYGVYALCYRMISFPARADHAVTNHMQPRTG